MAAGGAEWRNGGSGAECRDSGLSLIEQRLEVEGDGCSGAQAVQSSDSLAVDLPVRRAAALPVSSVHSEAAARQECTVPDSKRDNVSNHGLKVVWRRAVAALSVIESEQEGVVLVAARFAGAC